MIQARATDFATWRDEARRLLQAQIEPADVSWEDGIQPSLFGDHAPTLSTASSTTGAPLPAAPRSPNVPASFLEKAQIAAEHADPQKYATLYRLLWKLTRGSVDSRHEVLSDPLDPDTRRLSAMLRDVREEEHRMHAFVRFRKRESPAGDEHWVGWYSPDHPVLRRVAPFFARRYPQMRWTLFTPTESADWNPATQELSFGSGAPRDHAPAENELDELFLTYYASVFNPARTNVQVMARHLPNRIQAQLPERKTIDALAREGSGRVARMKAPRPSASEELIPAHRADGLPPSLPRLRKAAAACRACPIGEHATQTVFGEGPTDARLMIVGEQPGDEEDIVGRPFVGPAGRLFDEMLERVGLSRSQAYVTNAVKHFKWEPRGKRRLHSKPNRDEIGACRGWLLAEVETVKPAMILCLGATAAQSFCGPQFRVQRDRGHATSTPWAPWWMATYHPSALLRAFDQAARNVMEEQFLADLAQTRDHLLTLAA